MERWSDVVDELKPLLPLQWKDLALDQDSIKLDVDFERYKQLDAAGVLLLTTARQDGILVGWYLNILMMHPHYRTTKFAMLDAYYLIPRYRRAANGLGLFTAMERHAKEAGAVEMVSITKCHADVSPLFDRLGWKFDFYFK